MFEELLYPSFVAMSPIVILERHQKIIDKYGLDNFLKNEEFKRAREMYETARYAIGLTAWTDMLYWITPGKKNETPDAYIIWVNSKTKKLHAECVEITQWEKHIDDMFKIIEKKINNHYPSKFVILIHISREGGYVDSHYFSNIHDRLKKYKISAGAVRFWTEIKNKEEKDTLLGELYPNDNFIEFKTSDYLNKYYSLSQQIIKIDIISGRSKFIFEQDDFDVVLPKLPELRNSKEDIKLK